MINLYWIASIWRQNEQKWWVRSQNIQNYAKLRKWSNYNELHRFEVTTIYNDELRRKPHSKLRKTTKVIKLYWIASIWRQNDLKMLSYVANHSKPLNYKSDQLILNCIDLTSKRAKMLSYVAKHSKPLNYESDQLILNCIDLTSKRSKMLSYVANHSKPLNYKSDQLILNCIDLTSKRAKMLSYSQNILNYAKLRKWSNYNELHQR